MSTTFRIRPGDTFAIVSLRTQISEALLKAANPSVIEPIPQGTILHIPEPDPIRLAPTKSNLDPDLFSLKLNAREFLFWSKAELFQSIETIHSLVINAPFEPDNPQHAALFVPFQYQSAALTIGGQLVFTGTVMGVLPALEESGRTVTISCYSKPGSLMDCTPSPKSLPLEFKNADLSIITDKLIAPFGLTAEYQDAVGPAFDKVTIGAEDRIFDALTNLAKQRGLIISNTIEGLLLFQKSRTEGREVAQIIEGESQGPMIQLVPEFDPQSFYSEVTGLLNVVISENAIQEYLGNVTRIDRQIIRKNPFLPPDVLRPLVFKADSEADVDAKFGRMFSEAIKYELTVDTFRDPEGRLWSPNTLISVQAPSVMIYEPFLFLIKSVKFQSSPRRSILKLVIPEAYAGQTPERLPWQN